MVIEGNFQLNKEPLYLNKDKKFNKFIYLGLQDNHYFVITSMAAFLKKHFYCDYCKKGFNQLGRHKCDNTCDSCLRLSCDQSDKSIQEVCDYCNKICFNTTCSRIHHEQFCTRVAFCKVCRKRKFSKHVCDNQKYCSNCAEAVELDHKQGFIHLFSWV